ncbi:MAG: metal-dependent hydrolase [Bacteroidetes bacterium]|nr:metal-dependent hydrolase [Bacteroidota bacterium]
MASAFSHAFASLAIGRVTPVARGWKFYLIGAVGAVIPDLDAIGFWAGVPYDSMLGHRGITHSFFFAFLYATAAMFLFYTNEKPLSRTWLILFASFFASTASHALLDACTTGGLGVDLFAPFYDHRYFLPWRVIKVSPISVTRFFSETGIRVLASEFVWIWIPSFVIMITAMIIDPPYPKQKA